MSIDIVIAERCPRCGEPIMSTLRGRCSERVWGTAEYRCGCVYSTSVLLERAPRTNLELAGFLCPAPGADQ